MIDLLSGRGHAVGPSLPLLVALTGLGFPSATALASEPEVLDPVVVTATRLEGDAGDRSAAVSVIDAATIRDGRQLLGLDEALGGVPGVYAQGRYNFAQDLRLSVRGLGARASFGIRGLRIFVDGVPATTPDGQSSVDDIDLAGLERIEVLRGPSGALYGSAAGGVLSLASEAPVEASFAEARLGAGEFGARQYRVLGSWAGEDQGALASVSRESIDGHRVNAQAERSLLNARWTGAAGEHTRLDATLALLDAPTAQDPGGLTAEQVAEDPGQAAPINLRFDTGEVVRQQRLGLTSRTAVGEDSELRLRAYAVARDFSNKLPFNATELDRRYGGLGLEYARSRDWLGRPARTLVGADLDLQDDDRLRRDNDDGVLGAVNFQQREQVESLGLFALHEQALAEAWRLDLGLRYDWLDLQARDAFLADGDDSGRTRFDQLSPSLGLAYLPGPSWNAYARIASAFETPTTTELARADGGGGFNADLEPETAWNYELGLRARPQPNLRMELAAFLIEIRDQLVPREIVGSPGRFSYENAGRSRNLGLEAALGLGGRTGWGLELAYTLQDFRYRRFTDADGVVLDGKRVPGVPRYLLNAALSYRAPAGWYATLEGRRVGELFAEDENAVPVDAYALADLRLGYRGATAAWDYGVYAGVNNLFDADYNANVRINARGGRYFEPAPGRNLYLGLNAARYF
jgi:iron complex outermembrane receptor protein